MLGSAKTNLPLLTLTSWVKGTSSFQIFRLEPVANSLTGELLYLCFCHRNCGFVHVFVFCLFKFKVSPSPACCEQSHWWTPPSTPSCPRQHPTCTGSCFTGFVCFKSIYQQTKFLPLKSLEVLEVLSKGCQENTKLAELEIVVTMLSAILYAKSI